MNEVYAKLNKCYEQYQKICKTREIDFVPEIALVLGSGLGDYADDIQVVAEIDYHEMEGFPVSTVAGHQGSQPERCSERAQRAVLVQAGCGSDLFQTHRFGCVAAQVGGHGVGAVAGGRWTVCGC